MEATLQVLRTLPEENYQVLRFLVAFLVQVRPGPQLLLFTWRRAGGGAAAPAAPGDGKQGLWLPAVAP